MKLPSFEYQRPTTVKEAVQMLADEKGAAKVIAGGPNLIPILAFRLGGMKAG
jgi:CO/xanthine dehydrogenase FAD-binding subunit